MTDFRCEDPARTGDYDYFDGFIEKLTGRDADDLDFYTKPPELPPMEQWEIDEALIAVKARQEETKYFMKKQIDQFPKSSEQRDRMYKLYGIEL